LDHVQQRFHAQKLKIARTTTPPPKTLLFQHHFIRNCHTISLKLVDFAGDGCAGRSTCARLCDSSDVQARRRLSAEAPWLLRPGEPPFVAGGSAATAFFDSAFNNQVAIFSC